MGTSSAGPASGAVYRIARFVEKPGAAVAKDFVASGDYYWNSGMFLFGARRYLEELETPRAGHRQRLRGRRSRPRSAISISHASTSGSSRPARATRSTMR